MTGNTKLGSFETAINDGINIFVRDVLVAKGIIPPQNLDALYNLEIVRLKRELATRLAIEWAKMPMID